MWVQEGGGAAPHSVPFVRLQDLFLPVVLGGQDGESTRPNKPHPNTPYSTAAIMKANICFIVSKFSWIFKLSV